MNVSQYTPIPNLFSYRHQRAQQEARNGRLHPENTTPELNLEIPGVGIARLGDSHVLDRHMNGVLGVMGIGGEQGNRQYRMSNGISAEDSTTR